MLFEIELYRPPASTGVVLRDPDQQELSLTRPTRSRQVEVREAEGGARRSAIVIGMNPIADRIYRDEHALVERVHDRAALPPRGAKSVPMTEAMFLTVADRQRVLVEAPPPGNRVTAISIMAMAVTANVLKRSAAMPAQSPTLSPTLSAMTAGLRGSSSGIPASILPTRLGADIGRLRVDAAAETREDGDQRAAEREADEIVDRGARAVVEQVGEHPVVPGDADTQPDDEETRHRAGAEGHVESRLQATLSKPPRPGTFERTATFMPMKPAAADSTASMKETYRRAPAELAVQPDQQEGNDRDEPDRPVLPLQVGGRAFLHGALDLTDGVAVPVGLPG